MLSFTDYVPNVWLCVAGCLQILQGALFWEHCWVVFALYYKNYKSQSAAKTSKYALSAMATLTDHTLDGISPVISLFQHFLCVINLWAHLSSCAYIYFTVTELWWGRSNRYCNYVVYWGERRTSKDYSLCVVGFKTNASHSQLEDTNSHREPYCAVNISVIRNVNKPLIDLMKPYYIF